MASKNTQQQQQQQKHSRINWPFEGLECNYPECQQTLRSPRLASRLPVDWLFSDSASSGPGDIWPSSFPQRKAIPFISGEEVAFLLFKAMCVAFSSQDPWRALQRIKKHRSWKAHYPILQIEKLSQKDLTNKKGHFLKYSRSRKACHDWF